MSWQPGAPSIRVRTVHSGDTTVIELAGELDYYTAISVNRAFEDALDRVPPPALLRLELGALEFMDSSGLAILLSARRRAATLGCEMTVTSTSPTIARLFELKGLIGLLTDE
jgi:anti-anti-sigma factor